MPEGKEPERITLYRCAGSRMMSGRCYIGETGRPCGCPATTWERVPDEPKASS